ncbi:MAG TPA: glycosyltransferase family 2 protein [Verrucomicrobiae bacterium]
MTATESVELTLIIPCYNEAAVLPALEARLRDCLERLAKSWEVVFVDDGSTDTTFEQLRKMHVAEPRFKVISLSRNFGHQAALCAGLSRARGGAVGVLDADLQDPPELFRDCLAKLQEGYDVVYAVRHHRKENVAKRACYTAFYRLLRLVSEVDIPLDSGDFCLMRRRVVDVLAAMPERNVFWRGMRAWTGFRQVGIEYDRDARAAGDTKYSLRRLIGLAGDGVFAFSVLPLRMATFVGLAGLLLSGAAGIFVLGWRLLGFRFMGHTASELPGWAGVVCLVLFLSGTQFLMLGCLGEYVGRIYREVKQRPRWIAREMLGWERETNNPAPGSTYDRDVV